MSVILNPFTGDLILLPSSGSTATAKIPFTYLTPSPLLLQAVTSTMTLLRAVVVISTPFDGIGASITLGTTADHSAVLTTSDIDPGIVDQYESNVLVFFSSDFLELYITASGSTQGAGTLLYTIRR